MADEKTAIEVLLSGTQSEQIKVIEDMTRARLCLLLGGLESVPISLEYIVTEVSVLRFNRIGSEGFASHSVEGEHVTVDNDDDFAPYMSEIDAYKKQEETYHYGKVRFI